MFIQKRLISSCSTRLSNVVNAKANRFADEQVEKIQKMVAQHPVNRKGTRVQWWKQPVYVGPHQHVFEQSPDFSFKDGRPVYVTSESQLNYKQEQIRLAKNIISLLKETEEVKSTHEAAESSRKKKQQLESSRRPSQKGNLAIS